MGRQSVRDASWTRGFQRGGHAIACSKRVDNAARTAVPPLWAWGGAWGSCWEAGAIVGSATTCECPRPAGPRSRRAEQRGARRPRATAHGAETGAPSARRCCRACGRSKSPRRRRLRPPPRSRRAPSIEVSRRSGCQALAVASALGSRPGRRTTSTSSSASNRCAERHARRTTRSELGGCERRAARAVARRCACGPAPPGAPLVTGCSSRRTGAGGSACRRTASPSTSSATWRSAVSRNAARFSILKKLLSAAGTRSLG